MTRLQHAIERTRAAVLARAGETPCPDRVGGFVQHPDKMQFDRKAENIKLKYNFDNFPEETESCSENDTPRAVLDPARGSGAPPLAMYVHKGCKVPVPEPLPRLEAPSWRLQRPTEAPAPRVLPAFPSAAEVLAGRALSRGALRLWELVHRLACDVAKARAYMVVPDQVTYHLPAVTVAGVLGYTDRHVRNLGRELEVAGVLDFGGHAQTVMGRNLYDGSVWAVRTRPEAEAPRVRAEEWRHNWRPGFAADVEGKTGAAAEISGLLAIRAEPEELYRAAKARAAVPDGVSPPAAPSPENSAPAGLRSVVEALPGLWAAHARHRAREVGRIASAMCAALNEPERRRYWCRELWRAFRATVEGRVGGLQALAGAVSRLAADLEEAPGVFRNPGAVLAARLRAA